MNQLLSTVLFLFFTATATFAQDGPTDKGVILFRGASALDITFAEGAPITLSAAGGYFVADKILIGLSFDYYKEGDFSDTSFNPFGRYYIKEELFGGARLIQYLNQEGDNSMGLELEGGYVLYLNDYVAIEPVLRLPLVENASMSINVGFSIYY